MMKQDEQVTRMKRINVVSLQICKETTFPYSINTIRNPRDVYQLLKMFLGREDREKIVLLCLDTKNKITAIQVIAIGSLNAAIIHPREVMKLAVLSNSASIIISHCHPSGDPTPSPEDIQITDRLKKVGELLGIELLDHVIVGEDNHFSLKENGMM